MSQNIERALVKGGERSMQVTQAQAATQREDERGSFGAIGRCVGAAGTLAILIGGFMLAAWFSGAAARWSAAGTMVLKTNMALGLLLAGAALILSSLCPQSRAGRACRWAGLAAGAIILLLGSLTLSEHIVGWDLGIDQLLAKEAPGAVGGRPNRMGPPGATSQTLLGISLLLLGMSRRRVVPYLGLAIILINLVPAVGYVYGISQFYGKAGLTDISWPTVVAMLGLGVGLMMACPESGPMVMLLRRDAGGALLRQLLPVVVLLPLGLGFFRVLGQHRGLYDTAMGTGLLMLSLILIFSIMLWRNAVQLSIADRRQKQAAEALRESEERFRLMLESAKEYALFMLDLEGRILTWNAGAQRMKGYAAEEIVGQHMARFYTAEDVAAGKPQHELAIAREQGQHVDEGWRVRKDGSRFWANVTITAMRDGAGELRGFTKLTQDRTEQRELAERVASLAQFPEENPHPVLRISPDGQVVYANQAAKALVAEVEVARSLGAAGAEALRQGAAREFDLPCGDGKVFSFQCVPLPERGYANLYGRDVTDRRQAEEALRESERLQGLLAHLGELAAQDTSSPELIEAIGECVAGHLGVSRCGFSRVDVQAGQITVLSDYHGQLPSLAGVYLMEEGYADYKDDALAGRTVFYEDTAADERTAAVYQSAYAPIQVRAHLTVPLLRNGQWVGNFWVSHHEPRHWTAAEAHLMRAAADRVWTFIERKQAEETLGRSQKTLSELVERSPFGTYIVDSQFRIAQMNASSQAAAFQNVRPVIGRDFAEAMRILWPEDVAAGIIAAFRHTLETGEPYYSPRFMHSRHDVQTVEAYEWELHRMMLPDGQYGVICYYYDSTKLRTAEAALRQSEELRRLGQEIAGVGSFQWNIVTGVNTWMPELEAMYGLPAGGFSGTQEAWEKLVHPDDWTRATQAVQRAFESQGTVEEEWRVVWPDGSEHWLAGRFRIIRDEAGKPLRLTGVNIDITERKRVEEDLRQREEQLRSLAESIPNLAWWANGDGYITWYNHRWYEYTGTTPQQMEGWGWQSVHDPEMLPKVLERWKASIATGEPFGMVFPLRGADGRFRAFLTRVQPMKDAQGRVLRWFGTNTDVEDIKQAEEAQSLLAAIVESSDDAILSKDLDGTIQTWNAAAQRILGYRAEEIIGKPIALLLPPERAGEEDQIFARMRRGERLEHFETIRVTKDGRRIDVSVTMSPLMDGDGHVVGASTIVRDITEDKRAAEAIRRSDERYRSLFGSLLEGFCIIEVLFDADKRPNDYRFLEINPAFEGQTGLHNAVGKRMREFAPDQEAYWFEVYGKVALTGEPMRFVNEAKVLNRWYDVSAYRIGGSESRKVAILFNDITETKRAEQSLKRTADELARSNKDLEQFAYVASHDLQEPLRMVTGYLQLIDRRYKDKLDHDAREFVQFAVDGATRMSRLITELLDYSRISTRGKPPEPVAMEGVLQRAVENLQVAIRDSGAQITHDALPTVRGDATQLVQLLQNLVGNAIKFRSANRPIQVCIAAHMKDDTWVFSVKDNGIGIEPQYADKIFLIFQRLHSRAEYPGTGIGLAICKKIVERHGGRIWLESRLGEGSTFFFTLGSPGTSR